MAHLLNFCKESKLPVARCVRYDNIIYMCNFVSEKTLYISEGVNVPIQKGEDLYEKVDTAYDSCYASDAAVL